MGRETAEKIWREYPILDYGKKWDVDPQSEPEESASEDDSVGELRAADTIRLESDTSEYEENEDNKEGMEIPMDFIIG